MPLSTDVRLRRSTVPRFANECVRCECDEPTGYVTLHGNATGWWTYLTLLPGWFYRVHAPACPGCAWRIYLAGWVRFAIYMTLVGLLCWWLLPYVQAWVARPFVRHAGAVLVLLLLIPYHFIEVWFPAAIDVIVYDKSIDYQFRNGRLALLFYLLNEKQVLSSDFSPEKVSEMPVVADFLRDHADVWPGPPFARGLVGDRSQVTNQSIE
jgi:hypothetical protein